MSNPHFAIGACVGLNWGFDTLSLGYSKLGYAPYNLEGDSGALQ